VNTCDFSEAAMAQKRPERPKNMKDLPTTETYEHKNETVLLRPAATPFSVLRGPSDYRN
jgi:hypothetical protein